MSFGEFLKDERMKRGMTQRQLAELVDLSNTEISRIESGERQKPSPVFLRKLSEVMDIPIYDLMEQANYSPKVKSTIRLVDSQYKKIMESYIIKNGWTIKNTSNSSLRNWDCVADNPNNRIWIIKYFYFNIENSQRGYPLDKFFSLIGEAAVVPCINKLSIAVNDLNVFNLFIKNEPVNMNLDISILLLDLDNNQVVQEYYIRQV